MNMILANCFVSFLPSFYFQGIKDPRAMWACPYIYRHKETGIHLYRLMAPVNGEGYVITAIGVSVCLFVFNTTEKYSKGFD